jgi:hypothetical protein
MSLRPGAATGPAALRVHDVAGRLLREVRLGSIPPAGAPWVWDGRDRAGARCPRGLYLLELRTARERVRRGVVLVD